MEAKFETEKVNIIKLLFTNTPAYSGVASVTTKK